MALLPIKLCADDYGLTPAVSRGILKAVAAGRLTATTAMTTRPHWSEAARDLCPHVGQIEVGLHLNLTLGAPLSAASRLAPTGTLPTIGAIIAAARRNRLPEADIRQEIACQLDRFEAELGRPPDFIDGHQHVHVLAPIRGWLFDELKRRHYGGGLWVRDSGDRSAAILRRRVAWPKALAVAWLGRGFADAARHAGFAINRGFAGFSAFSPDRDYGADFRRFLVAPGQKHLIMCHPGHVDDALLALDPATESRKVELAFLLSDRLPDLLAECGMTLAK